MATCPLTSIQVGMWLIWSEEETLSGLQAEVVEEEDTETPNVSGELAVEAEDERTLLRGETWGREVVGVWMFV